MYDTAQICLNGHVITTNVSSNNTENFCSRCGCPTITKCPSCSAEIRGFRNDDILMVIGAEYTVPYYCYNCGSPYPWTQKILDNAVEILSLDGSLNNDEKILIKNAIPNLLVDVPDTPISISQYKKIISNAGDIVKNSLHNLLVDVVSETAKKALFG